MASRWIFPCIMVCILNPAISNAQKVRFDSAGVTISIALGIGENGEVTQEWAQAVRSWYGTDLLPTDVFIDEHPLTNEETEWYRLIREKAQSWSLAADSLQIPFTGITPPKAVYIVLGNVGGQDAFTYSDTTIGFDLSKLVHIYGPGSKPENNNRIDRFFAHEFTHLMHKAWRKKHPVELKTSLDVALWDCLVEGIGNYRSLSSKWVDGNGALTERAEEVLARLQVTFVERIAALENASSAEATVLMEGLSMGRFDQKWGALTVALWLAQDAKGKEERLQKWISAGPQGVLTLARTYLPEELKQQIPR